MPYCLVTRPCQFFSASSFSSSSDVAETSQGRYRGSSHPPALEPAGNYHSTKKYRHCSKHRDLIDYIVHTDMALAYIDRVFDLDFHSVACSEAQRAPE